MDKLMHAGVLLLTLLFWCVEASGGTSRYEPCRKNASVSHCKQAGNGSSSRLSGTHPKRIFLEMSQSPLPTPLTSTLSKKQAEMRESFITCMKYSTAENPTADVVDFVFREEKTRQSKGMSFFFTAPRGSTAHHGHEICLARAFGLRGFRNVSEIEKNTGGALVGIFSPYVNVVDSEIPESRRVARAWVRDYVVALAEDMHRYFASREGERLLLPQLRVTSMIRSFEEQDALVRRGRSPADCRYQHLCSSHTSGSAIDLGLQHVHPHARTWLEERLVSDQLRHRIFFIRENSHYHVFVLPGVFMGEE